MKLRAAAALILCAVLLAACSKQTTQPPDLSKLLDLAKQAVSARDLSKAPPGYQEFRTQAPEHVLTCQYSPGAAEGEVPLLACKIGEFANTVTAHALFWHDGAQWQAQLYPDPPADVAGRRRAYFQSLGENCPVGCGWEFKQLRQSGAQLVAVVDLSGVAARSTSEVHLLHREGQQWHLDWLPDPETSRFTDHPKVALPDQGAAQFALTFEDGAKETWIRHGVGFVRLEPQDLWVVSAEDALSKGTKAGRHYALATPAQVARMSPDGKRALLHVWDTSRARVTYPTWVEVLTLQTGERKRLTPESDWWQLADWLPDGRIVLLGAKLWLSDPTGTTLTEGLAPGYLFGAATDGGNQIAWTYRNPDGAFGIGLLNVTTGKHTDYPGPYLKAYVNPHAGVPVLFSPDGNTLAFMDRVESRRRVLGLDLTTGRTRVITEGDWTPVLWGDAGLWLWRSPESSSTEGLLVRLNAQGEEVQRITVPSPPLSISPDGRWLTVSRYGQDGSSQTGLLHADTGDIAWIPSRNYNASGWTAEGELVLLKRPLGE